MHQTPEPSRLQLELREAMWAAPGYSIADGPTSIVPAWLAAAARPAMAECTCPADCLRDHEHE